MLHLIDDGYERAIKAKNNYLKLKREYQKAEKAIIDLRRFNVGRPKLPIAKRKSHIVTGALNARQWNKFATMANEMGMREAELIRFIVDTIA